MATIHDLVRTGNLSEIQLYLEKGGDVNVIDKFQRTPLHLAAWSGNFEVLSLLIQHHADLEKKAMDGFNVLHFAVQSQGPQAKECVQYLCKKGKSKLVFQRITKGNKTALHLAVPKGNAEIINILLEAGLDPTAKTGGGQTATDLAKDSAIKQLLLDFIANNPKYANHQNPNNNSDSKEPVPEPPKKGPGPGRGKEKGKEGKSTTNQETVATRSVPEIPEHTSSDQTSGNNEGVDKVEEGEKDSPEHVKEDTPEAEAKKKKKRPKKRKNQKENTNNDATDKEENSEDKKVEGEAGEHVTESGKERETKDTTNRKRKAKEREFVPFEAVKAQLLQEHEFEVKKEKEQNETVLVEAVTASTGTLPSKVEKPTTNVKQYKMFAPRSVIVRKRKEPEPPLKAEETAANNNEATDKLLSEKAGPTEEEELQLSKKPKLN